MCTYCIFVEYTSKKTHSTNFFELCFGIKRKKFYCKVTQDSRMNYKNSEFDDVKIALMTLNTFYKFCGNDTVVSIFFKGENTLQTEKGIVGDNMFFSTLNRFFDIIQENVVKDSFVNISKNL